MSLEDMAARLYKNFFTGQEARIRENVITELSKGFTKQFEEDEIFDIEEENDALLPVAALVWFNSGEAGFDIVNNAFEFGLSWDVVRPEWSQEIDKWGLQRVNDINTTTMNRLNASIIEGIEAGESIPQISNRVADIFTQSKDTRSVTIARTETHNGVVGGTHITYKAAGVEKKSWLVTQDGREREWHGSMDGQTVGIDEMFIDGLGNELLHPGDPTAPPETVINCRCAELPVIEV